MQLTRELRRAKFAIIAAFLITIVISPASYSQAEGQITNKFKDKAEKALINNMNSSNRGVSQSAIYMAGYYKYSWTVEPLITILDDATKEVNTRILAAYSLFMIGDERGLLAIKIASVYGGNFMVQGTCDFIYNDFESKNNKARLLQRK
jgi:hypothetical protein